MLSRTWLARGVVLVAAGFAAGFAGWSALAEPHHGAPDRSPAPAATAGPAGTAAPAPAGEASLRRAIGQKIMTRMAGPQPSPALLRRVTRGEVGGVILFARNVRSPAQVAQAVARLQAAAARGGNPRLLIAVDQEGGAVRRLPWAPPTVSAAQLGADPANALAQGEATGRELRRVGVNLDLAPVLDVPAVPATPLGSRAFGRTPEAVSRAGCAFAAGLHRGGALTTAKHFPGLGYATANTDLAPVAITAAAPLLRAAYAPYRACPAALDAVMVANASYPTLGARGPAVFSPAIVQQELRGRVGFRGVVISDSLDAVPVRDVPGAAALAALAGVDVLMYPKRDTASSAAFRALLAAAGSNPALRRQLTASARRIRALKAAAR